MFITNLLRFAIGYPATLIYQWYKADFSIRGFAVSLAVWLVLVALVSEFDWKGGRYALEIR